MVKRARKRQPLLQPGQQQPVWPPSPPDHIIEEFKHLPNELIFRIAYNSSWTTAYGMRLTCSWLRTWIREADIREVYRTDRGNWLYAAFTGRVELLERIHAKGKTYKFCRSRLGMWDMALRLACLGGSAEVAKLAFEHGAKLEPNVKYGWAEVQKELKLEFAAGESMAGNKDYHHFSLLNAVATGRILVIDAFLDAGLEETISPFRKARLLDTARETSIVSFAHLLAKMKSVDAKVVRGGMTTAAWACRPDLMRKIMARHPAATERLYIMLKNLKETHPDEVVKTLIQNFPNEFFSVTNMSRIVQSWKIERVEFVVPDMSDPRFNVNIIWLVSRIGNSSKHVGIVKALLEWQRVKFLDALLMDLSIVFAEWHLRCVELVVPHIVGVRFIMEIGTLVGRVGYYPDHATIVKTLLEYHKGVFLVTLTDRAVLQLVLKRWDVKCLEPVLLELFECTYDTVPWMWMDLGRQGSRSDVVKLLLDVAWYFFAKPSAAVMVHITNNWHNDCLKEYVAKMTGPEQMFTAFSHAIIARRYEFASMVQRRATALDKPLLMPMPEPLLIKLATENIPCLLESALESGIKISHACLQKCLCQAATSGSLDCVRLLIQHGADVNLGTETPLLLASRNKHAEIVKHLLNNGADVQISTALDAAMQNNACRIMSMLLWKDADVVELLRGAIRRGDRGGIVNLLSCIEVHNARILTLDVMADGEGDLGRKIVLPFNYLMEATRYDYDYEWVAQILRSSPCLEVEYSSIVG
ncbi:hypothetical protein HK097_004551 [Rhizophlyctis rosea]|uniref:Uncharacterized protein n=1 Tax=Rhizophlyctis rosea TaxID=64517 RepID=A0AAD5SLW6_9FUNG|nr:hypothetical protein HK097_004551 [Rhizophlyctis rosea]